MTVRTEARVVRVEVAGSIEDVGAAAARSMPPGIRHRYTQPIRFMLEDGTKVPSYARALTKPKLAQRIERYARNAEEGSLFVSFHDGVYWGTILKFSIGAGL